jgi:hypothetical protein
MLRADCSLSCRPRIYNLIHEIGLSPLRKKRQRRSPLGHETKLFGADPKLCVDTKTAVDQVAIWRNKFDMGAMRISGLGPSFAARYVYCKVSTFQSYYRAMLVAYSVTAQSKSNPEGGAKRWSTGLRRFWQ